MAAADRLGPEPAALQRRLRELQAGHRDDVIVFSAHDAAELERLRGQSQ